jgi:chromosome segregation ATPase
MSTGNSLQPAALDLLATMQSEAIAPFEVELSDLRTTMMAMATSCEKSLTRLRGARWISFDDASRMVAQWREAAESERSRAEQLAADLEAVKHELDDVRAECRTRIAAAKDEIDEVRTQCEVEIAIAREAASSQRDERAAARTRELNAARELARSAMNAEANVRERLAAIEARNQEIVDAQMLRMVELQRELDRVSAEADRARPTAEKANREAPAPNLAQPPAPKQSAAAEPQPRPVEAKPNHLTPEFDLIDAVVAGSPPIPLWERTA